MKTVRGDLLQLALEGQFDAIVHGCNCMNTMGAGIAKPIARLFPEAFAADQKTAKGDRAKLGTISFASVSREDAAFTVINAYTQYDYRGKGTKVDYDALRSCFEWIAIDYDGARIGYPMIGAGLAGGDWDVISQIIDTALRGQDHTLVMLPHS